MIDKLDVALGSVSGLGLVAYLSVVLVIDGNLDIVKIAGLSTFVMASVLLAAKKMDKIF